METACRIRQDSLFAAQRERSEAFGTLLVEYLLTESGLGRRMDGRHPLTGLVRCGRCGGRMVLRPDREDGSFCCSRCGGADFAAKSCRISAALLFKEIARELSSFVSNWGEWEKLAHLVLEAREGQKRKEPLGESPVQQQSRALFQAMAEYLRDKEQEKEALYRRRAQGEIDPMDFLEQRHQLWRERSLVERNLSELKGREQRLCQELEERSRELLETLQTGDGLSNRLLRLLLYEVAVRPRDKSGQQTVWLYWNF